MSNTDGLNYTPLFHSEISSSYLIHEIFNRHDVIAREFLKSFLGIELSTEKVSIEREHSYYPSGSIDLFIRFEFKGRETHVLIEVKVHDYLSASKEQIIRYYDAARKTLDEGDIYFIYLTQFNKKNQPNPDNVSKPPTIEVFEESKDKLGENLIHASWQEFHDFLTPFIDTLSEEERIMVSLQKKWMIAQSKKDLSDNTNTAGQRPLSEYFDDITFDIEKELHFGNKKSFENLTKFVVPLRGRDKSELNDIYQIIVDYSKSDRVNKSRGYQTEPETLTNVKAFLAELAQNENSWLLLYFYTSLFEYIHKTNYLKLNGVGETGLSIKLTIKGKGNISLCRLWLKDDKIEFSLLR
ncbi:MAG: PD-(D/E)XK nuclease family protein [Candidatus Brocadiales bacterium]|nr:PD-(D/E)XK nuclease family protein [Candidatus Brocadiales bacterium]